MKANETLDKEIRLLEKQPTILSVIKSESMRSSARKQGLLAGLADVHFDALIARALLDLVLWDLYWPALCSPSKSRRLMTQ
jgi:hypothetical protein